MRGLLKVKCRAASLNQSQAVVEAHTRQLARVSAPRKHVLRSVETEPSRTPLRRSLRPDLPPHLVSPEQKRVGRAGLNQSGQRVYPSGESRSSSSLRFRPSHERSLQPLTGGGSRHRTPLKARPHSAASLAEGGRGGGSCQSLGVCSVEQHVGGHEDRTWTVSSSGKNKRES